MNTLSGSTLQQAQFPRNKSAIVDYRIVETLAQHEKLKTITSFVKDSTITGVVQRLFPTIPQRFGRKKVSGSPQIAQRQSQTLSADTRIAHDQERSFKST